MAPKQGRLRALFIVALLFTSVGCGSSASSDFSSAPANGVSVFTPGAGFTDGSGSGVIPGPGTGVPFPFNPTPPEGPVTPPVSLLSPTAVDDLYFIEQGQTLLQTSVTGVAANDMVEGGEVAFPSTTVAGGTLTGQTDGSFVYAPPSGFVGIDSFDYTLSNSVGDSAAQVTITVNARIFRAVSLTPGGTAANSSGFNGLAISGDGGLVAFASMAANLDPPDSNGNYDIFLADTVANIVARISNTPINTPPNNFSGGVDMTPDANLIVYGSRASDIVPGDTNGVSDIFLFDRTTGVTERVSLDSSGLQLSGDSSYPSISDDGRFVVFSGGGAIDTVKLRDRVSGTTTVVSLGPLGVLPNDNLTLAGPISGNGQWIVMYSRASNLVADDTNGRIDVFLYSVVDQTVQLISRAPGGPPSDNDSGSPQINFDGSLVVFDSDATNLVEGDTNGSGDCFLFDRVANTLVRVSTKASGEQIPQGAGQPFISADGLYVAFASSDNTIVANDTSPQPDVFLKDISTGNVALVSLGPNYEPGNSQSGFLGQTPFSDDGRFVTFPSFASNWIPGDVSGQSDVFEVTNPFYRL